VHLCPWHHPPHVATAVAWATALRDDLRLTFAFTFPVLASAARRPWQLMDRVDLDVVVVPVAVPVAEPVVALVVAIAAALNTDPAVAQVDQYVVASRALVERM